MLAPRRRCLDYSKVYRDVTESWSVAWNQNKQITYYIFSIPIPNSSMIILTIAQTCYQQISLIKYF